MLPSVLVVGGNGFIGSAVCKAALAKGMTVTSISSSGKPFTTPRGHSPSWTSKVTWVSADALLPSSYAHLLPGCTAVVHTLGTLFEDASYKDALRSGDFSAFIGSVVGSLRGANPLERKPGGAGRYERMNRDAALRVCEAFVSAKQDPLSSKRAFVYLSAEDIFRPFVPARYIETKREAEWGIRDIMRDHPGYRAAFIRPSLVYHSHFRPLTTPIATLLDLSATIHRTVPVSLPTPARVLRSLAAAASSPPSASSLDTRMDLEPSPLSSVANALTVPPIHVDHVADAICRTVLDETVEGVVDVQRMRSLIGWGAEEPVSPTAHHA